MKVMPMPDIILTEVQTCVLRMALRRFAETLPDTSPNDPQFGRRDCYALADKLDPFVRMRVGAVRSDQ